MPHAATPPVALRTTPRYLAAVITLLLLASSAAAQATPPTSVVDGKTPSGLAPGSPSGSYPLSGFETVNLFNGSLNFSLPLLKVGGRGGAGYAATLQVEQKWVVKVGKEGGSGPQLSPNPNWWQGIRPGYGPGVMHGRRGNDEDEPVYESYGCDGVGCTTVLSRIDMRTLTRLTFTAADGTEYELRDQQTGGQPQEATWTPQPGNQYGFARGKVFVTADAGAATFLSDVEIKDYIAPNMRMDERLIFPTGHLLLADGTRYRIDEGKVTWVRDRHGNRVTFTYGAGARVATATDPLGRQVTFTYDDGVRHYDEIGFSGFGGAARTVRVWYDTLERRLRPGPGYSLRTFYGLFGIGTDNPSSFYNPTNKVAAVELPDGRRYELYYNPYGELARVELPTGGAIEYDWDGGADPADATIFRHVTKRRVYPDGGSAWASQTEYVRGLDGPNSTVEERTTDPGGALLGHALHYFHGDALESLAPDPARPAAISYGKWREGREYRTEAFDVVNGAPVLRQVVARTWRQPLAGQTWPLAGPGETDEAARPNSPQVAEEVTTLSDSGQASRRAFAYDRYGNATDTWEYDYGAPAYATRRTHTDYLTTNVIGGTTYDYACDPTDKCNKDNINPDVIHQRGLARARQVYAVDPATGAETLVAKSETRYDEAGSEPLTYDGIVVPGWADPATPARGNATSMRGYADASAAVAPDQACPAGVCVETHARYDQLGNVRLSWDAKGNKSEVLYGDSYCNGGACGGGYVPNTFAFPTSTRTPKPDPSGTYGSAAELTSSTVYDFHTGLVYSSTDANNQTTRYEYADPLDRPTAEVRPDADRPAGVRTDVYYSQPQEASLYVRTLADFDGTRRLKSEQYFDRMGRPSRSFTWENQDTDNPWLTADTHYDALGRAWRTSNPYRSAGPGGAVDAGRAGVETTFDALGRVRQVKTTADGAVVRTDYSGSRVLVTDQAGRQRISKTDALGRLSEVWEVTPNDPAKYPGVESIPAAVTAGLPAASAHGYLTGYTYDAPGNLRAVAQGTQPARVFAYDSLSRLTSARNPEGGTVSYAYDANGNLTARTDARGTTAAYGYDALNRNTTVTYALGGQTAATPNVYRHYDNNPATNANGKGRLWKSEAAQTAQTTVDRYDEAGRPLQQTQKFWVGTNWGPQAYTTTLTYNLAGGVTELTYPSGHRASYRYDAMGRLGDHGSLPAFEGTLGDGAEKVYASQVLYDPLGGMSQERYGTDTPVHNKRFYNVRGQLSEVRVSTHPITNTDQSLRTDWNRGALINHYSDQSWAGSGMDNNGNLRKQDVYIPAGGQGGGHSLGTFFYEYDALNRLTRAKEGRNGADQWAQAYDYDRWGNRTLDAAGTWMGEPSAPPSGLVNETQFDETDLPNTNRLYAPGDAGKLMGERLMRYDGAGNLVHDGYTGKGVRAYDAENRMTSAEFFSGQLQTAAYVYDADGRRVKRLAGTDAEAWQVYGAGGELLAEYAPNASPASPRKEYGYRGGELLVTASPGAASPTPTPAQRVNVAAASSGATASASTSHDQYGLTASKAINGSRTASGSYWNDGPSSYNTFPDDLEVTFAGSKTIGEVDLYFLQDGNATAEPTEGMTFTQYGVTKFEVQYSSGGGWVAVPNGLVEANNRVWRKLTFPAVTTDRIRVRVTGASDVWSRVVEVEAYEAPKNVAAASSGATATASSSHAAYGLTPEKAINGSRTAAGSYWNDSTSGVFTTAAAQEYLQVNFAGAKTIGEVDVYFLQDGNGTAEPTEAMTCTQYGLVKFDVQYRQGTQWVTVPGGGVTGNNKVWRKFTFAPVTTDAIRVLVHGSADVWSRVVEVEAYEGTAAPAATDVRWLVTDHLGTPRMVVDRTGSLAGVSRHDYLPFGEELYAGTSGRALGQGYGTGDNVRQKFTKKERDGETSLDFFEARYYSSAMGRFTSPDEFTYGPDELYYFVEDASANPTFYAVLTNPQSLNKYQYTYNNPLRYVDPDGHVPQIPVPYPPRPVTGPPPVAPFPGAPNMPPPPSLSEIFGRIDDTLLAPWREKGPVLLIRQALGTSPEPTVAAPEVPALQPVALPQEQPAPNQQARPTDDPDAQKRGHKGRKSKASHDRHTGTRSGDKQPPNYRPYRKPPKKPGAPPKPPKEKPEPKPEIGPDGQPRNPY